MPLNIHYDCDPGQDDAVALLSGLGSDHLRIMSVSVVAGNAEVEKCARNALQLLAFTGREDVPVYVGCAKPLCRSLLTLPQVFGPTGMAGAEDLPQPSTRPQQAHATHYLATLTPMTVVATGPLTNLAATLQQTPRFAAAIEHLVVMGGCVRPDPIFGAMGNLTVRGRQEGKAEYNFALDPEAAQIVFKAGITRISLIGLEVARPLLFNGAIRQRLDEIGTETAKLVGRVLSAVGEEDRQEYRAFWAYPEDPVRAIYDLVAMMFADRPDLFETEVLPLRIDVEDIPGRTLIDATAPDHPAVEVITKVNHVVFWEAFFQNLARLR